MENVYAISCYIWLKKFDCIVGCCCCLDFSLLFFFHFIHKQLFSVYDWISLTCVIYCLEFGVYNVFCFCVYLLPLKIEHGLRFNFVCLHKFRLFVIKKKNFCTNVTTLNSGNWLSNEKGKIWMICCLLRGRKNQIRSGCAFSWAHQHQFWLVWLVYD